MRLETQVRSLCQEVPLKKALVSPSIILPVESHGDGPVMLCSMGRQQVRQAQVTNHTRTKMAFKSFLPDR